MNYFNRIINYLLNYSLLRPNNLFIYLDRELVYLFNYLNLTPTYKLQRLF